MNSIGSGVLSQISTLNFSIILESVSLASSPANSMPRQLRGPKPKARKAAECLSSLSIDI